MTYIGIWPDEVWASRPADQEREDAALKSVGFDVRGRCNGKPKIAGEVDWLKVQGVVTGDCPALKRSGPAISKPAKKHKK